MTSYFTNVVKKSEIGKDIGFYFRNNNFIGIYNKKAITEVIASCDSAAIRFLKYEKITF